MNIELPPQQNSEMQWPADSLPQPTAPAAEESYQKNSIQAEAEPDSAESLSTPHKSIPEVVVMEVEAPLVVNDRPVPTDDPQEGSEERKELEDQAATETRDKKKKQKKAKNLKCSTCLKKKTGNNVLSCKSCSRIYHLECLNVDPERVPRKFQCDKCRLSLKEKQHKKKIKAAKLHEKIAIKLNSENKKSQKQLLELMRKHPPTEPEKDRDLTTMEFALKFPYYTSKNKINFPIEDDLFDQYASILPKNACLPKPEPTQELSRNFGVLLQLWNCLQTFPQYFQLQHKLRVYDLQATLEYDRNLIFVEQMYIHLLSFYVRDIFNERFEANKHLTTNAFLSLLRYCGENNAFDRIFRFVWPEFVEQLIRLPDFQQLLKMNDKLSHILSRMREKHDEPWMPRRVDERYYLFKALLSGIVDTSTFHDLLYEKIEQGRQNTRQKNQYQENLKDEETKLQTIKETVKNLEKELKQKQKALDQAGERQNKPKLEKQVERVTQALQAQSQQKDTATKNVELLRQNIEYTSNSTTHTSVWLLGQDKERRSYWFLLDERDKLFVSAPNEHWSYYDYFKINNDLIKSLNQKGIREKNLYDTLQQYKKSNYFIPPEPRHGSSTELEAVFAMESEHEGKIKDYKESNTFDFDSEKFISFGMLRSMLTEGERKIYNYLEERNARWSTPEDREIYLQSIRRASTLEHIMEAVRHLNEKICVVEIEYKYQVEDENQQNITTYDSKTRKIQTKMWGINEKYKHAWLQYGRTASSLQEVFYLVAVLYLTIERYVKKMRETRKIKKEVEDVKLQRRNKLLNKADGEGKEIDASQWDENCHICKKWGDLLCCDMCPKVFHLQCIGLTEVPEGEYKCRECEEKRQTRSRTKKILKS